jgi:probable Rubsico expression protein CbbX
MSVAVAARAGAPALATPSVHPGAHDTAAGIHEVLAELDRDLVGLAPVKRRIREIAGLLVIDRMRLELGIASTRPSLHMCFTGNPGTGKTTVATRMAEILHRLGYIEQPRIVTVTRDDLVGQYVGHTAPKTKDVIKRAFGGVLFIDEAYYLHRPDNERDYGAEAVEVLLHVMEAERERLVVIFAGYRERMESFFGANPGMGSRVAHHVDFPDYTADELLAIGELMAEQRAYELTDDAHLALRRYVDARRTQPRFANARSIRNAIDRARLRQAARLFDQPSTPTRTQLTTIEASDILQSSVLERAPATDPEHD